MSFTILDEWVVDSYFGRSPMDPRFAWLTINIVFGVNGETGNGIKSVESYGCIA